MSILTVACVLKSGGEYKQDYVRALSYAVATNLKVPHRFKCLSDLPGEGYTTIELVNDFPGWFSKIELFRKGIFPGPVFYIDLDTAITGSLDDIVLGHTFTVLENFWTPGTIGSGLMAWNCDLTAIYDAFCADPKAAMAEYTTRQKFGDQGFIQAHSPVPLEHWQTKFPGRVASYRKHCLNGVPEGVSVICYGGKVRPWNTKLKAA